MISEDLAGQSMTMAQKSVEIAVELARLLKSMYDNHAKNKREKALSQAGNYDIDKADLKSGEIKLSQLKNSGYEVSMQDNISARNVETITAKAEQYDIPVSFVGKGENAENVTLAFRTDDKAVVDRILKEVMTKKRRYS